MFFTWLFPWKEVMVCICRFIYLAKQQLDMDEQVLHLLRWSTYLSQHAAYQQYMLHILRLGSTLNEDHPVHMREQNLNCFPQQLQFLPMLFDQMTRRKWSRAGGNPQAGKVMTRGFCLELEAGHTQAPTGSSCFRMQSMKILIKRINEKRWRWSQGALVRHWLSEGTETLQWVSVRSCRWAEKIKESRCPHGISTSDSRKN